MFPKMVKTNMYFNRMSMEVNNRSMMTPHQLILRSRGRTDCHKLLVFGNGQKKLGRRGLKSKRPLIL